VIAFRLKYQDPARCFRRVTQPPHIAGPLAHIFESQRLSPRTALIKFYLDNINSTFLSGLTLARFDFCPRTVIISFCYNINSTGFYRDLAIAQHKTCANSKELNQALYY
jgi:hypothetical protein